MSSLLFSAIVGAEAPRPCRLCLKSSEGDNSSWSHLDSSLRIDNLKTTTTLRTMINSMRMTQIHNDDALPQYICDSCVDSVIRGYLFLHSCEESEKQWRQLANDLYKSTKVMEENVKNKTVLKENRNSVCVLKTKQCTAIISTKGMTNLNKMCNFLNQKGKSRSFKSECVYISDYTLDSGFGSTPHCHTMDSFLDSSLNKCSICGETFNMSSELETHIAQSHYDQKENFQCAQCPEKFCQISDAKKHQMSAHNSVYKLACQHCGKMYQSVGRLLNHEEKHKNIVCDGTQYECKTCNRKFSSLARLKYHLACHSGVVCEKCGRNFKYKSNYTAHLNRCQNERKVGNPGSVGKPARPAQYTCDYCNNKFKLKVTLKAHIKGKHLHQNTYKCGICDKRFSYKSGLNTHRVVHTKERPHQCSICGNFFVTKPALVYHMRLHTGERPFPCELCGERFLSASRRMSHVRKKHWGRTEECSVCSSKFFTPYAMRKHMSRHFNPNSKLFCNK